MRAFNSSVAGVVASVFLLGSVGGVSSQELFEADPVGLQFEREVRSTYIVRLSSELPSQAVNSRANEVGARFGGRIKYVYTNSINGFAITMPSVAFARMLEAGGLGIVSAVRDEIITIDVSPNARGGNGKNPVFPPAPEPEEPNVGDKCTEKVPWGVQLITSVTINTDGGNPSCAVTEEISAASENIRVPDYDSADYSVCVIDTGVYQHPDLNVDTGKAEYFIGTSADDEHGHGTHVAGTIGAIANGVGVVGVAPNVKIIPIRVLDKNGSGSYSGVIAGVDAVADTSGSGPNCAVANMSLGGNSSSLLIAAVRCASARNAVEAESYGCSEAVQESPAGVTFTLAAGNDGGRAQSHSPANASIGLNDNMHTIAAMTQAGDWAGFSNHGQPPVDYIQPGVDVYSTFKGDTYETYSGTSMAAPHMAGLVIRDLVNVTSFTTGGTVKRNKRDIYNIAIGY